MKTRVFELFVPKTDPLSSYTTGRLAERRAHAAGRQAALIFFTSESVLSLELAAGREQQPWLFSLHTYHGELVNEHRQQHARSRGNASCASQPGLSPLEARGREPGATHPACSTLCREVSCKALEGKKNDCLSLGAGNRQHLLRLCSHSAAVRNSTRCWQSLGMLTCSPKSRINQLRQNRHAQQRLKGSSVWLFSERASEGVDADTFPMSCITVLQGGKQGNKS